jgi:hypothetical protein
MAVVKEYLIAWQEDVFAQANIVVEVKNTGNAWVHLEPSESDFTIYEPDDTVATTGSFLYSYPAYLGPGQTGYFAEEITTDDAKARNMKRVETNTYFNEADQSDAILLTVAKVKNTRPAYSFDGITTSGTVTNRSGQDVTQASVGAFYFDGNGRLLGFSYTNLVENLADGQTKGFKTVSGAPPSLRITAIKRTEVLAAPSY